jgi:hypothetical protein
MEQRFKVGDSVTYLSHVEASAVNTRVDRRQIYYYGGRDFGGTVGIIREYIEYNARAKCWKIYVSTHDASLYAMLECEFHEYTQNTANGSVITNYEIW